jgi:hypothetical protein
MERFIPPWRVISHDLMNELSVESFRRRIDESFDVPSLTMKQVWPGFGVLVLWGQVTNLFCFEQRFLLRPENTKAKGIDEITEAPGYNMEWGH